MKEFWKWLARKETAAAFTVLGYIGAGIWAVFTFFVPPHEGSSNPISNFTATDSVVATNINNSTISFGAPPKKSPSIIRSKLPGLWGEQDCREVSYRISIVDQAVVMESAKHPSRKRPYRFVGTIVSDEDREMEIRGEEPQTASGSSTTLLYQTNGVTERLVWTDHGVARAPVIFDRCR